MPFSISPLGAFPGAGGFRPFSRRSAARFFAASVLGLSAAALLAAPEPRLETPSVTWYQRGSTNRINFKGDGLVRVDSVLVQGTGVKAWVGGSVANSVTLEAAGSGLTAVVGKDAKSVAVDLVIAPDAPLGAREVRLAGPEGVSNPVTIHVSDLPERVESGSHQQLKDAQSIPLPAAISGVISSNAESDYYKFKASAGENLIFDVQANRTGSPLDSSLVLYDSSGKELARNEDGHGLDSFLEFKVPTDGEYVLQLHDLRYQGGGDYRYRLVAGVLPYLESIFPYGGRRGTSVDLKLVGHNLADGERMTLNIAGDAPLGRQDVRARTPAGLSNPQSFEVGDLPESFEVEPNNTKDIAPSVSIPSVINGRIGEKGDVDTFRFKSPVDQKLVIEVFARRFGSPLDALLTLMDGQGNLIQRNDDAAGPDARIEFDAKKETEYLASLRDLTDRGGDAFGYRMLIRVPESKPDFSVRVAGGRYRIHQGGSIALRCEMDRRNGFDGLVRLTGTSLPTGVLATPLIFSPQRPVFGWFILTAAEDATTGYQPLALSAVGEQGGRPLVGAVQFGESAWLTVLPRTPFTLEVAENTLLAQQNDSTVLDVSVLRRPGFDGAIKVAAEDLSGVEIGTLNLASGQARGQLTVRPSYNAEVSTRPIMVRGEATVEGSPVIQYASTQVPLTTHGIPFYITAMLPGSPFFRTDPVKLQAVALPPESKSAANSSEFVVKVDRRDFTNEIQLQLEGVPDGVTATVAAIAPNAKEATIRLLVTDKAASGKDYPITVVASATTPERTYRQKSVPVTLFIAAPEKETAAVTPAK
jgi:hypothetical protein